MRTAAKRDGDEYVVNGSKTFITNGVRADFYVTAVRTTEDGGHHGLSFLVIERDMAGFEVSRKLEKLGWHASDTGELSFSDVRVPAENLLGEENKGFYLIMANFQWERISMALGAVGGMQATFERTLAYAKEREAFGRPIGQFQVIRHKLAEMATRIEAARATTPTTGCACSSPARSACRRSRWRSSLLRRRRPGRRRGRADPRRLRLHARVRRRARPARRPPGPDRRRHREIMKEIIGRQMGL